MGKSRVVAGGEHRSAELVVVALRITSPVLVGVGAIIGAIRIGRVWPRAVRNAHRGSKTVQWIAVLQGVLKATDKTGGGYAGSLLRLNDEATLTIVERPAHLRVIDIQDAVVALILVPPVG